MAKITKIPLVKMNQDDADSILPIGDYRSAKNIAPANSGVSSNISKENIKGNSLISNSSLPAGTNKCIGTFSDEENNQLIYFNYNSNSDHAVYAIDPETSKIKTLISGSVLNFQEHALITGIGVTNKLLYWSDGVNPQRVINMDRVYGSIDVGEPESEEISLLKHGPLQAPAFTSSGNGRETDSSKSINFITNKNLQFSYRYIFLDDEESVLSPYSEVSQSDEIPDPKSISNNYVRLSIPVDEDIKNSIKNIEVLVREGNSGDWKVFHKAGNSSFLLKYYGDEFRRTISEEKSSKLFESVPNLSLSLSVFKNRTFLDSLEEGFDTDEDDFSISLSQITTTYTSSRHYFKEGGYYNFGVIFSDDYGRVSGVKASKPITIGTYTPQSGTPLDKRSDRRPLINLTISGTPPEWATNYRFVRTNEQVYEQYMQVPVNVLFYVFDKINFEGFSNDSIVVNGPYLPIRGSYFLDTKPINDVAFIVFQLPKEVPFIPDDTYSIRILTDIGTTIEERIVDVKGDLVYLKNFGITDWTAKSTNILVEIFKNKKSKSEIYYEFGSTYPINNPGTSSRSFSTTSISNIEGDTYYIQRTGSKKSTYISLIPDYSRFNYTVSKELTCKIESPSPTMKVNQQNASVESTFIFDDDLFVLDFLIDTAQTTYNIDYEEICSDIGRPNTIISNERQSEFQTTVRFSDTFVQDSLINGLSSFDSLNKYTLPSSRTPIVKLQPAGNVLLAIHERDCSSLYVNENILVSSDGADQLTKSDDVIGTDRALRGGYGTLHPESVVEHEGRVYWFDASKGEVVRYDLNGLVPIGSIYKMRSYFKSKGEVYSDIPDVSSVIGGYDPFKKMYFLTFVGDSINYKRRTVTNVTTTGEDAMDPDFTHGEVRARLLYEGTDNSIGVEIRDESNTLLGNTTLQNGVEEDLIFTYSGQSLVKFIYTATTGGTVTNKIYDSIESETVGFLDKDGEEGWVSFYDFTPEYYGKINNKMYMFKGGNIYEHDEYFLYNNFFGAQYDSEIKVLHNENYSREKIYRSLSIESDDSWEMTSATNPEGQETNLLESDFTQRDGVYYADFLRDVNSTVDAGKSAIMSGDEMRSKSLDITLKNNSTSKVQIDNINIAYLDSPGHRNV